MNTSLAGKKIAVLVDTYFEQKELTGPREALEAAGAIVEIVSPHTEVHGMNGDIELGFVFQTDVLLDSFVASDYHALVIPGGVINADHLRILPQAQNALRDFMERGKPVAIICHGPWLLISAGLAHDRRLTSYRTLKDDLINAGAEWLDQEVVIDHNLITSRNPNDLPAFNHALIEKLCTGQ